MEVSRPFWNPRQVPVLLKKYEPLKPDLSAVELRWALDLMGSLVRRCDDVELTKRVRRPGKTVASQTPRGGLGIGLRG